MTALQLAIAHVVKIALVALLAGIVVRSRARLCWSFAAYVAAVLAGNTLASLWPERFHTQSFWVLKQGAYDALKMAIALELAWRASAESSSTRRLSVASARCSGSPSTNCQRCSASVRLWRPSV